MARKTMKVRRISKAQRRERRAERAKVKHAIRFGTTVSLLYYDNLEAFAGRDSVPLASAWMAATFMAAALREPEWANEWLSVMGMTADGVPEWPDIVDSVVDALDPCCADEGAA